MKKSLLLGLLVVVGLFALVGCGNAEKEPVEDEKIEMIENGKQETVTDETLFTIKDKEFHLDTDKTFEGLNYKTSSEFREIDNETPSSKYMQYDYRPEDGSNYFYFRIFYYAGKDFDFARNDLGIEENLVFQDGKTESIEYKMIDRERTDGVIHFYFISKDDNTFVLNFVSQNDIHIFEEKVLESIKF